MTGAGPVISHEKESQRNCYGPEEARNMSPTVRQIPGLDPGMERVYLVEIVE